MKLGMILQTNKDEHIWNVLRLGITALKDGDEVTIFLLSEGVELETVSDTDNFDISAKIKEFKDLKGEILACGTCLKLRDKQESAVCPISTMSDLHKMIKESDKVLVFG